MNNIVCICGSTRFKDEIAAARADLTLAGQIVLGPEVLVRSNPAYADLHDTAAKERLDALHLQKIDLADSVYVVNPGGYIGDSTRREIAYAREHGKVISFLESRVHNHGTEDGPGLSCRERIIDGRLIGSCLSPDPKPTERESTT